MASPIGSHHQLTLMHNDCCIVATYAVDGLVGAISSIFSRTFTAIGGFIFGVTKTCARIIINLTLGDKLEGAVGAVSASVITFFASTAATWVFLMVIGAPISFTAALLFSITTEMVGRVIAFGLATGGFCCPSSSSLS